MIPKVAIDVVLNLWPMLVLICIVLITIRIAYLLSHHKKLYFTKEMISLCFIVYIILLFELVTTTDFESYSNNFIPFKEMLRYSFSSKLFYRNVLGNIALFIPFGYFISYYCKFKNGIYSLLVTLIISASIEFIQMGIGRSFDIDDIILNVIGGFIGYIFYKIIESIFARYNDRFKNNLLLNLIFIIIIIFLALVILNLYGVVI